MLSIVKFGHTVSRGTNNAVRINGVIQEEGQLHARGELLEGGNEADRNDFTAASTRKLKYLRGLKGNLGVWLHVMRDLKFPRLSQGLTEEQKSDILRRFDELQKYTAEPPDYAGRKVSPELSRIPPSATSER